MNLLACIFQKVQSGEITKQKGNPVNKKDSEPKHAPKFYVDFTESDCACSGKRAGRTCEGLNCSIKDSEPKFAPFG
jgi:hypothetical protein